ncbi:hemolysin family protein [Adhaeribacter rhizoryzae]|uniref:HlyC/CorC family transporter n=1 Tax=Adhaeribacter rhizoryzae TaxID=2607907 RepID=A0A5M6DFV8_9BACT|nr:hemolysin family protein [Adhaeribacter rhizoryzae]KAA5546398.1 HlyC/CorC family transporter [Adhaeribacter rhizoryzae]
MIHPQIPLILTALLFSAFFSGMEMAFMAASKLQLELQEKQNSLTGRIITHFSTRKARLTATLLIGNVFALVLFGIGMARSLYPILTAYLPASWQYPAVFIIIQTLVTAILALTVAEFIPRSLFMIRANTMLNVLAVPLLISYYILYPVVFLVVGAIRLVVVKLLKMEFSEEKPVFGLTDVDQFMKKSLYQHETEKVPEVDARIFHNALEFRTVKVRECMVPRTEIEAIEISEPINALRQAFVQTGHSKILVYQETIDNVVGYCHQLAMFQKPTDISSILTPIIAVPETMLASELFVKFVAEHRSIALVVDEFGGTSGLVTTEDLLEEIIGEINDEFDEESLLEQELQPGIYLFSARQEIDYLNDKYNLALPVGDYETLGGLILEMHGDIPNEGTIIQAPPFTITVLSMDENRINTVQLVRQAELTAED